MRADRLRNYSMIRKSECRFSEKIMLSQNLERDGDSLNPIAPQRRMRGGNRNDQYAPNATGRNACNSCWSSLAPMPSMIEKARAWVNGSR